MPRKKEKSVSFLDFFKGDLWKARNGEKEKSIKLYFSFSTETSHCRL
jgi:hypothetical protein